MRRPTYAVYAAWGGVSASLECEQTTLAKTAVAAYMVWNRDTLHRRRGENE